MEVKGIGQGGQVNSDSTIKTRESSTVQTEGTMNAQSGAARNEGNNGSDKQNLIKEQDVRKAVDKLNKFMEDSSTYAEYSVHEKFGDVMIKIINKSTKEVVLEVPPRKMLDMVAKMCELAGVIFDRRA